MTVLLIKKKDTHNNKPRRKPAGLVERFFDKNYCAVLSCLAYLGRSLGDTSPVAQPASLSSLS